MVWITKIMKVLTIEIMKMSMIQMGTKMACHLMKKISIVMKSMKMTIIGNTNLKISIHRLKGVEENLNLVNLQKINYLTKLII